MELFAVRPMDFLVKPVTEEKLKAVWELYHRLYQRDSKMFYYEIRIILHFSVSGIFGRTIEGWRSIRWAAM